LADALGMRAGQLVLRQEFDEAAVAATEALQLVRELGADNLQLYPLAALAVVSAVRGDEDDTTRKAKEVLEHATANGLRLRASMAVYALALLDLGRSQWIDALKRLDSLTTRDAGSLDPFVGPFLPDRIEAAVRAARMDEADARPFDLARIQLLYGEHLRRMNRRVDARVHLRAALEEFERLRAEPWAERARAELRATGETARKRNLSAIDQLTPQELQIASLVGAGETNKEVAAQLFISPRTVDYHLRKVFQKLGISSRAELIKHGVERFGAAAAVLAAFC
jgi:DNA-binding CsgD family transcriptional regulator